MRNFKKRTIALCLASFVTVLGSFAENTYQNSLMSLRIDRGSYGTVSFTAFTKKPFLQTIKAEKAEDNTYYIILPEVNSEMTSMPSINGHENIESLQISTFPYAPGVNGYTRITVKTKGNPTVSAEASLYIPDKSASSQDNTNALPATKQEENSTEKETKKQTSYWDTQNSASQKGTENSKSAAENEKPVKRESFKAKNTQSEDFNSNYIDVPSTTSNERIPIFIGVIVLTLLILLIVFLRKDQMASIVGDQNDFDFDDDDSSNTKKSKSKTNKIKNTINKLDNTYKNAKPVKKVNIVTGATINSESQQDNVPEENESEEPAVIVDLDSLYNEKNKSRQAEEIQQDENSGDVDDLADFLNEFSFDEDVPQEQEEQPFDEELYNDTINNDNLNFSKNDSQLLNQLMQNEIGDETLNNIEEFAPKEPITPRPLSEMEILENILADYTIKQNLSFSKDDVDAIKKLINVELDQGFITDLRTNPQRTEAMRKELEKREKKPHKTSEMLILNVKDLLPDLSREMQKQGNKRIESEAKHDVVYYSEGYEVSKLAVSDDLLNMSEAIHNKEENKFRPSDDMPIAEGGYEVSTLSIKDVLPDIEDYKKNPKKYETKKTEEKVDENALLHSIENVQFKPFYDNVQKELSHFEGFEVIDNEKEERIIEEQTLKELEKYNAPKIEHEKAVQAENVKDDAQKLLDLIEERQAERENKKQAELKQKAEEKTEKPSVENQNNNPARIKLNGSLYSVIKSAKCGDINCFLIKNGNAYFVIAQQGGSYKVLKKYEELKTENLQTRVNETNADGSVQYLVRVSVHKFIVNVTDKGMEFVMDLC